MKRLLAGVALLLCLAPIACPAEEDMLARVTVYWRGEDQGRASWNGARLHNGFCAVDPHKIPYGSKVMVDGEELSAVDTGPAVVSRKAARAEGRTTEERSAPVVDRYFESKEQALAWANSHPHFMMVRVAPPSGNEQASLGESGQPVSGTWRFGWRWGVAGGAVAVAALPLIRLARRRASGLPAAS